jgi:hypothetical protein
MTKFESTRRIYAKSPQLLNELESLEKMVRILRNDLAEGHLHLAMVSCDRSIVAVQSLLVAIASKL